MLWNTETNGFKIGSERDAFLKRDKNKICALRRRNPCGGIFVQKVTNRSRGCAWVSLEKRDKGEQFGQADSCE